MTGCARWLGLAVLAGLLLGPLLGLPLYLDWRGVTAPGVIVSKQEVIRVGARQTGSWSCDTSVVVRYQAADRIAPQTTSFSVDTALYDRLVAGAPIAVRYPPNRWLRDLVLFPTARPADQSTLSWLRNTVPPWLVYAAPLALGAALLFVLWRSLRGRVKGLGWLLVLYLLGALVFTIAPFSRPVSASQQQSAVATVRAVHPVKYVARTRRNSTRNAVRVLQPYDLVELEFVPTGQAGPVLAVDAVDTGSVPGLAQGATVPIVYAANDPRASHIVGGRQTYRWKNGLGLLAAAFAVSVVGIVGYIISTSLRYRLKVRAAALTARVQEAQRRRQP